MRRDLRKLPVELRDTAEAAAAIELAKTMDQGFHIATSSKELRTVLTGLRARAAQAAAEEKREPAATAAPTKGPGIADLTARIAESRRSASSG